MRQIKIYFLFYVLLFSIQDTKANTNLEPITKTIQTTNLSNDTKSDALKLRRLEIKNMDKSTLTHSQKKSLRKEVNLMNKEQVHGGGGIYLSLSAIVVVLLLLIILL